MDLATKKREQRTGGIVAFAVVLAMLGEKVECWVSLKVRYLYTASLIAELKKRPEPFRVRAYYAMSPALADVRYL